MKKTIGVLGVAVIAVAMFLNTNAVNGSTEDTSLANLLSLNSANAECLPAPWYNGDSKCLMTSQTCVGDIGSGVTECRYF